MYFLELLIMIVVKLYVCEGKSCNVILVVEVIENNLEKKGNKRKKKKEKI